MIPRPRLYEYCRTLLATAHTVLLGGEVGGLHRVPLQGPCIVAANHCSFLDPPLVGCHVRRPFCFFARRTLWKPGFPAWWLDGVGAIPVDRDSGRDVTAIRRTLAALEAGGAVVLFPEGTRSPDGALQKAQPGIGFLACRSRVPVVPARLFGSFEAYGRHRRVPRLRAPVDVGYGPPLLPAQYDPGTKHPDRYQEAADRILAAIAAITPPTAPARAV